MMKFTLILFAFIGCGYINAQDLHFTQIENTIVMNNPALVGKMEGYAKLTTNYRSQWVGSNSSFNTSYGFAEFNFGKKKRGTNGYIGVGSFFLNDVGGQSRLGMRSGGINASGHVPLSKNEWLSAGMNVSFNQRTIDLSNVTFLSQWDGSQLNSNVSSGENVGFLKDIYTDVGLGLAFHYDQTTEQAFNAKEYKIVAGVSIQHLTRPQMNFISIDKDRLHLKTTLHFKYEIGLSTISILEISGAQFFQGPHAETIFGMRLKNKFKESSHFTSLVNNQFFTFGTYFRSTGDLCPTVSIDFSALKFAVVYDYNVRIKSSQAFKHSLELQLSYLFSKSKTLKF